MFKAGDIFHDLSRGDYFRLVALADDGEWDIVSERTPEALATATGCDGWFHPIALQERIDEGSVLRVKS